MITSHCLNASWKSLRDDAADLLRLQVVRVVIAVRQHVGADQDAALHFRAEAFGARLLVHVEQIAVLGGAMAVAHAVETRQVRRGFRRRDHVVHGDRQLGLRQRDLDQRGAECFVLLQGGVDGGAHVVGEARAEVFLRQADAQAGERLARPRRAPSATSSGRDSACSLRRRATRLVESRSSKPAMALSSSAQSVGALRHRAALVERRGERDHAVARHAAVGRLDAGDAGERRRAGGSSRRCPCRSRRARDARPPPPPSRPTSRPAPPSMSHGFCTGPKYEFSLDEPIANSSMLVLPTHTMPARFRRSTTVASNGLV